MIGKLIKYEFKHTSKTMFTTWIVLAAATLMGSLALYRLDQGNHSDTTFSVVMNVIMLVLYIIALIGIFYVDFIYLCYHYHKTMYSSQGYLTHYQNPVQFLQYACGYLRQCLALFHNSQIIVRSDMEYLHHLIQHSAMLPCEHHQTF